MAHFDSQGLPVSTDSELAAAQYREGVALLLATWPSAAERFDAAIASDPSFALAYAARARLDAVRAEPAEARKRIAKAEQLATQRGDERERSHVQALSFALNNQPQQALAHALAHLDRWPRDILIMSLPLGAFGLFAFSGMANHNQARVALCERHAPHFAENDWWFLTYRGWSLAENGEVVRGRTMLERSFQLRPQNANGVHALSHALFEAGAGEEAEKLILGWLPSYDRSGILHGHIAWHAALIALERGDAQRALEIYETDVHSSVSKGMPINIVSDAASLLWRLDSYGYPVSQELWRQIADYADKAYPKAGHAFIDTHMLMIAAATKDSAALEQRVAALESMVASGSLAAGSVVPVLGRALAAFSDGNYAEAAGLLEPVAAEVMRIGGSGAQREIIEDTMIVALMRSGQTEKALALLDRRLHRRPSPRDARWRGQLAA